MDSLIVRAPGPREAREALDGLRTFPGHLLQAALDAQVRIWLLEPGEAVRSVPLLRGRISSQRWLDGSVGLDDCAGLTVRTSLGILVIAPWDRPAILRHEMGHAFGALLDGHQRRELLCAFEAARSRGRFVVPLAGRSLGEYLACGVAQYAQVSGRGRLLEVDPGLGALLAGLWQPRERYSLSCVRELQAAGAWFMGVVRVRQLAAAT